MLAEFPAAMPPAAERVAGAPRGGARIRKDCSKQVARLCPHPQLGRALRPTQGLVNLFFQSDYDKVKNLTPLSCCFPWAPQPTNVKARAAAFTACLDHSRSPRGGSPSSLAPKPTVVPSMEQETPTLQPEEPTVTQLPVEECQQEPASPTPFLPMPKSAAATQLDTDMDKEQEEVPAWNCSPTSPADHTQEDDDGLQQQLQRAEHLTMTLDRVNVRDSDSELSGISDEDDEEEPDDKMSQKDEGQDEHQDQDEWRWVPLESGRWQGLCHCDRHL